MSIIVGNRSRWIPSGVDEHQTDTEKPDGAIVIFENLDKAKEYLLGLGITEDDFCQLLFFDSAKGEMVEEVAIDEKD